MLSPLLRIAMIGVGLMSSLVANGQEPLSNHLAASTRGQSTQTHIIISDHILQTLERIPAPSACYLAAQAAFRKDVIDSALVGFAKLNALIAVCGRRFDPQKVAPEQLDNVIDLYVQGKLDPQLFAALDRKIALAPNDSMRRIRLSLALGDLLMDEVAGIIPARVERAEAYLSQMERLPGGGAVREHNVMLHAYPRHSPRWEYHMQRLLADFHLMEQAEHRTQGDRERFCEASNIVAYRVALDGDFPKAISVLEGCLAQGTDSEAPAGVSQRDPNAYNQRHWAADNRAIYAMVGKSAPTTSDSADWFNVPPGGATLARFARPVTLLMFTGVNCSHCYHGYPVLQRLYERYQGKGMMTMLVSYVDAPVEDLGRDRALAYMRQKWADKEAVRFPIAVMKEVSLNKRNLAMPMPHIWMAYNAGMPSYVIIDQYGIIRYIQPGDAEGLEAILGAAIERVLDAR